MTNKLYNRLLLFSLFGTAMWFFGNLYEAIVIAPNIIEDSVQKMLHFQKLFTGTNPALYYMPLTAMASMALAAAYFKTPKQHAALKRNLKISALLQLMAYALSAYIITQINFKLFFADLNQYSPTDIHTKAIVWNVLNFIRLLLVGASLAFLFRACVKAQQTNP